MALRSLAARMRTPASSALCQRPGPSMAAPAAASRFLGNIPSQVGDAKGKDAGREYALTTLRNARKHEKVMRGIKVFSGAAKFFWWTYILGVTAAAGLKVVEVANKVAKRQSDGPAC